MEQRPALRHRLLAIMAADGVGYSRLISLDERATVAALDAARDVFRACIAAEDGRVIDTAGDSVLAVFETATGAVNAALDIQQRLADAARATPTDRILTFRIGVHLGDVFEKVDGTVYGDGVNVAARLEGLALPGRIAVSQSVQSAVQGHVPADFIDLGEQSVKNITQAIRVFRVQDRRQVPGATYTEVAAPPSPKHRLSRGLLPGAAVALVLVVVLAWRFMPNGGVAVLAPSPPLSGASGDARSEKTVAVLPFANLSDEKGNEYFADGVSEELLNLLARVPGLRVTARASAARFKGTATPVGEIGRQLGVGYLVEGSVRKAQDKIRVSAQLLRAADGQVLWSETFDRPLNELLTTQTDLAVLIAKNLRVRIDASSLEGSGTKNPEAWQLYRQGLSMPLGQREDFFNRALRADPLFARAHAALALEVLRRANQHTEPVDRRAVRAAAVAHADEALRIDPKCVDAHVMLAYAAGFSGDAEGFRRHALTVMQLDPNSPDAHELAADTYAREGRMDEALAERRRASELDPLEPVSLSNYAWALARAHQPAAALEKIELAIAIDGEDFRLAARKADILLDMGRHQEALALARKVAAAQPPGPLRVIARLGTAQERAQVRDGSLTPAQRALFDLYLGHTEAFLDQLEAESQFAMSLSLDSPALDAVRASPRFRAWLKQHKLEEANGRVLAWRAARASASGVPR